MAWSCSLGEPLDTPAQYFIKYFTPSLLQRFAEETNKYYFRTTGQNLRTTSQEIQTFFGMSIIMANFLGNECIGTILQDLTK